MHKLASICVRRPVFATMLVLALTVVGAFSYFGLSVDLTPKVDIPTVAITTVNPGATAEEIETEITKRIEDAVNTISGIDEVRSTSVQGLSTVTVTFSLDKDGDVATQEVRDKVSRAIPDLPETAETPVVTKFDPDAQPILQIVVSAARPIREVTQIADKIIKPRLENVKGVGEIQLVGGLRREIRVWVDPDRMRAYGLSVAEVANALRLQNMELPAGSVTEGASELTVRTLGRLASPEQFNDIAIVSRGPYVVKLRDIGYAEDAVEEPTSAARLNGNPAVTLVVSKQSGTNIVATANLVKERIRELEAELPPGVKIELVRDQAVFIQRAVNAIQTHLIEGSLLASVIIFFFLSNIRTTLIAAVAIPTSIIATFALMKALDMTLNQITMLALTLMVGVVIDDAIIVLENIYRYIEEKNMPPMAAAVEATKEIGLAVMATTFSLLAVFVPIGFMGGIVGRFMSSFGFTSAFAVAVSLLVSFTLTPMLSSRFLKAPAAGEGRVKSSKEAGLFRILDRTYTVMLEWAMHHRKTMVTLCVLVVLSLIPLFLVVGKSFTPVDDRGEFNVDIRTPEGTSLAATTTVAERIARDIRALPGVVATLTTVGSGTDRAPNAATIYVKLVDQSERADSQSDLIVKTRELLQRFPGNLRTRVGAGNWSGNADLAYSLSGPDLDKLGKYSAELLERMKQIPYVVDADTSLVYGKPELRVEIDRQRAADLGVRVSDIAQALNTLLAGQVVSTFPSGGELYDVRLRAAQQFRTKREALNQLTVASSKSGPVSLDQVVRLREGEAPSSISRLNRQRQVTVSANVAPGGSQADITNEIDRIAHQDLNMEAAYSGAPAGQTRELARTAVYFLTAVALTFIFMYMVLAAQFESFLHPFTILLTLPLSVPFGIFSLWAFGQTINVFSGLGLLLLFGIVKKNAILQIDHTNGLRAKGTPMYEAIIQANRDRLRPILMTTMALVAGMLPVAFSSKAGAASNRAIGVLVVGGQSLCLLLTLLAVPVFYSLFEDAKESRLVRAIRARIHAVGARLRPARGEA